MSVVYKKDKLLSEGKTKKVFSVENNSSIVIVESKDDITAGDGAKREVIPDKGTWATATTSNVFRLLEECGKRTAFREQISPTEFVAEKCDMTDLEVIARREGHGSHLKRNPHHQKGVFFPKLLVEFYLKTSDKKWRGKDLPVNDPLIQFIHRENGTIKGIELYRPDKPLAAQVPFMTVDHFPFKWDQKALVDMEDTARTSFLILEKAWLIEGYRLVDFKIEFGFNADRKLVLADVIDNDSWRIVRSDSYYDKQVFRDGGELSDVAKKYSTVAEATKHFRLPRQRIILWRGSEGDDISSFETGFENFFGLPDCELRYHTRSMHKQTRQGLDELDSWVNSTKDGDIGCVNTVVIAYVGMSNGAGPTLAAHTHVPVIACSPTVKDFPEDIWSSLRMPSGVPLMTVLSPRNALLAAFGILAIRSPRVYALLRRSIEERL
ncbi:hypothetical protein CL630_03975 [bacterium]|nr:hypothetical protein [bacterium]|tara:strand:- start:76059 stop:77366 length:1308 start_codon:yes stop_codon:yes gene_type:complete